MALFNRNSDVQQTRYRVDDNTHRDVFDQIDLHRKEVKNNAKTSSKGMIVAIVIGTTLGWLLVVGGFFYLKEMMGSLAAVGADPTHKTQFVQPTFGEAFSTGLSPTGPYALYVYGLLLVAIVGVYLYVSQMKEADDKTKNASHLNTYTNDGRLIQPEELINKFDLFPDAGAHSSVEATAILSHMMLDNSGVGIKEFPQRYEKTVYDEPDENGYRAILHYAGEEKLDENGDTLMKKVPVFDGKFSHKLFDSSLTPIDPEKRIIYSPNKLLYNPKDDILGKDPSRTAADFINKDWHFPDYEVQRPGGAYIVDTDPNNTMLLAMTRAGKGQDIIEPTIDMWLRMDKPGNIVVNDPKGELYRKFFYPASKRGFEVISFNLINDVKTNIYNPLGYAVEAARKDDNSKVEEYVKAIGDVFFPTEKADDPMWPNAANATFKRSALGLIDFYKEEDMELRERARVEKWPEAILKQREDELWGHVTPYNVYQMMTQLAAKKSSDASFIHVDDEDSSEEKDYLTLFFDATNALPKNELRTSVGNEDNSLRAMAGSDKTISSVYGISLTAVKFFADEKIRNLTSGRPSQNFDMVGMAFPRRIEIRFDATYLHDSAMEYQRYSFSAYEDAEFKKPLGKDFDHDGTIDNHGWLIYAFKGIFPKKTAYIKLLIKGADDDLPMNEFYFKFTKGSQVSLDGTSYVRDPVSDDRIIRDGTIQEMRPVVRKRADGTSVKTYVVRPTTYNFEQKSLIIGDSDHTKHVKLPVISQSDVHYTEKPRIIFCVTPPHMMSYAKLILIMLNQMFNMQVDKAYLTKANQKPLYMTRYMLDEIGNLQSEGNGIPFLQTKESIGLGQSQQYTLILQTLQQLRDIYGDSIDKILQANTSNIVYLKSTDTTMLEELQKMSGTRHETHSDSQSTTIHTRKFGIKSDPSVSVSTSVKEVPVISINDMLRIPRNSDMVFGHGDPIWSINQTALPMSWQLHSNQVRDVRLPDGYSLLTVPSISNTAEFDTLKNMPNFTEMVSTRVDQARQAPKVLEKFKEAYGIDTDDELHKLDQEKLSKQLMAGINANIRHEAVMRMKVKQAEAEYNAKEQADAEDAMIDVPDDVMNQIQEQGASASDALNEFDARDTDKKVRTQQYDNVAEANTAMHRAQQNNEAIQQEITKKKFARNRLSQNDLLTDNSRPREDVRKLVAEAYGNSMQAFAQDSNFHVDEYGTLRHGNQKFIVSIDDPDSASDREDLERVRQTAVVDGPDSELEAVNKYLVKDEFIQYLAKLDSWSNIARGKFDAEMANAYVRENEQ